MTEAKDEQAQGGAAAEANQSLGITSDHGESIREAKEAAEGGNKFQQAIAAWRTLDLTKLISNLDTAASDLVTHQKDSLVQRKELAQKTKDFRKLEDSAKLAEVKDMLKAYQNYIDVISNHSKSVSSAFMQAYSPLSEAPDPYPLLEASIDSLVTAEEVVPQLESENERLQKQVAKLNGQLEDSEKQLEEERTKRQSFEGSQDSRIKEVEESWSAALREKEDNWTAKEQSLQEKVENQDRLLKELKANYEVSQRLEKSGEDAQESGKPGASAAELEIVQSELDRANTRLAEIEGRNEHLRVELAQSTSSAHSSGRSAAVEDDPAFLRLRSENTSLLRKLDAARSDKDSDKSGWDSKMRSLEREMSSMKADRDALQGKVQKWSDYDEVRRELDMLRAIEFSTVDDIDDEMVGDGKSGYAEQPKGESLEQLLMARNKKLSNELTELRVSHNETSQRLETLQEDLSRTNMDLEKTQNLNATLENDLQKTQQEASNAFETMSMAGTYTSKYPKSSYGGARSRAAGGGGASPTSSIIGGFDPSRGDSNSRGTLDSLRVNEPSSTGILPMVTAQRDRFKKRIGDLEAEVSKTHQTVSSLRSEIASLQRDNLNLYEKTRYVSTYNRSNATSSTAYGSNPNPSTIAISPGAGDATDRYRSAYEANISPFSAFRGRETARAMKRMTVLERGVWQITRVVLATRTSRNLFAGYCLVLHLLVFYMLYYMGTVDVEKHASALGASALAGSAAGDNAGSGAGAGAGAGADLQHGEWQHEGFDGST
ncbi:hypothetical protein MBLNU230_g7371t1 [Neophaeotheca triangularis]